MHHSAFWSCFREYSRGLIQCSSYRIKLSHRYNTRANCKKKMEGLEQENRELREEVVTLRSGVDRLTALVETLMAAQNQNQNQVPPPNAQAQGQTTVISEIAATTIPAVPVGATQQRMPNGYPWGMPEGYLSVPEMTRPLTPVMVNTSPIVHTGPFVPEPIYDAAPSEFMTKWMVSNISLKNCRKR